MPRVERPYFPIIYVRGYAGSDDEIDETVADPYMGFNIGATKFRQAWTGAVRRHYFESPLYRLVKDFGYTDVYSNGEHMPADMDVPSKSIVIYRYYDEQFFENLGHTGDIDQITGRRRDIEQFAGGLSDLILHLQKRICGDDVEAQKDFRVYLVAHSMGGLIVRCLLQNSKVGSPAAKQLVDKVFTYATPHGGIDFSVIGNVPSFFSRNNADNFNQDRMKSYLGFDDNEKKNNNANDLNGHFDPQRFFCLVGTNWKDYTVAGGWSRRLVGPSSDGLVRITNASVFDSKTDSHSPRAFVHRSHSGHYGIVNSEDGYQNLTRFLFGDVRVDGVLKVAEVSLPKEVQEAKDKKKTVRASYHFETVVRVRGGDWDLHRRTTSEESAIFRTFDQIFPADGKPRSPHLFSTFLSKKARVSGKRSLVFSIEIAIQVPEYEIDGFLMFDQKIRGSYLYRDTLTVQATPTSDDDDAPYSVKYGFDSKTPLRATKSIDPKIEGGVLEFAIPIDSKTKPGFKGTLLLWAREWV
ncbi:MAG: hypothetical protein KDA66_00230 [Planctomycetaceae bacterium]|nr:hypothetical protein [Planctomycetaceae bacterium]